MPLRPLLPVLALLACAALPSAAAATGFTAQAVSGQGTFALLLEGGTWKAVPPPEGWHVDAATLHLKVVDDQRRDRIPSPLTPGNDLYSHDARAANDYEFAAASLAVERTQPGAVVLGLAQGGPLSLSSLGPLAVAPSEEGVIERSHFYGPNATNAGPFTYEFRHAAGPALALGLADLPAGNGTRLYVWGANLTVRDAAGTPHTYRTGEWTDPPTPGDPAGVRHFAHAFLDLQGASAPLRARDATAYATSLALRGDGDLLFHAARGSAAGEGGTLRLDGDARVAGGAFRLALDGTALRATPESPLRGVEGAVVLQRGPFPWLPLTVGAVALGGLLYALPAALGARLARHAEPAIQHHRRSEAYAHWASRAQMRDWLRLAVWFEGRAVHNAPTVGEFRTERAILLRQAGRLEEALAEHRRAHDLLAHGGDGGYLALNAFQAALAGAEAGRDAEAVRWLQTAIEADRGLLEEVRGHPTLRRLAEHPDYGAVVP